MFHAASTSFIKKVSRGRRSKRLVGDAGPALQAGHDIRHAAIGPGTANSHGYERTHVDGLKNTYDLLMAYLGV